MNDIKKPSDFQPGWITQGIDDPAIDHAKQLGEYLAQGGKGITRTQVRNFFGELRRIQGQVGGVDSTQDIALLRPKLAYVTNRIGDAKSKNGNDPKPLAACLHEQLTAGLEAIAKAQGGVGAGFSRFVAFVEATLAYHRFYGGQ